MISTATGDVKKESQTYCGEFLSLADDFVNDFLYFDNSILLFQLCFCFCFIISGRQVPYLLRGYARSPGGRQIFTDTGAQH